MSEVLKNKLRTKTDLHNYMSQRLNVYLPEKRYCRLSFLQDILGERKSVYTKSEIREFSFNSSFEEYSVKNAYPLISNSQAMKSYLPSDEMDMKRYPDKKFFWAIAFTTLPQWCRRYHMKVLDQRATEEKKDPNKKRQIDVTDNWMQKLLQYDHKSQGGKYGKGRHSILIKQDVKPFKKREQKIANRKIDLPFESFYGPDGKSRKSEVPLDQKQEMPKPLASANERLQAESSRFVSIGDVRARKESLERRSSLKAETPGKYFDVKQLMDKIEEEPQNSSQVKQGSKKRGRTQMQSQSDDDCKQALFGAHKKRPSLGIDDNAQVNMFAQIKEDTDEDQEDNLDQIDYDEEDDISLLKNTEDNDKQEFKPIQVLKKS